MKQIVFALLIYIQIQWQIINYLLVLLVGKNFTSKPADTPINKLYQQMQVDCFPLIETPELLDYKQLLAEYKRKHGKPLKPVKRHKNSKAKIPNTLTCPHCSAPHTYLYDNNGGKGQFYCKVCENTFNYKLYYCKSIVRKCPYCNKTLAKIKERKQFNIYKCKNDDCPYYKVNLALMTKEEKELFKKAPFNFKVRYIYRKFKYDFKPLSKSLLDSLKLISPESIPLLIPWV